MTRKKRILIVEDEEAIIVGLTDVFIFHGYEVEAVRTGNAGLERALEGGFDMVILDVMLPGKDGFSICNEVRTRTREQPIIMLTAKSSDEDIIKGLTLGADDYIAKPFSVQELVLRVEAVLRRSGKLVKELQRLVLRGGLTVDCASLSGVTAAGAPLLFTRREIEIFQYLASHKDAAVHRAELLEHVWGYKKAASIDTRTVDIHIAKLRKKIEDNPKDPKLLLTVRGEGYQLILE